MSVEEHPLAEMQRRTCEVPNRGHRAPCQPIRASIRTALLPFLVGAAVLVSACMPLNVVEGLSVVEDRAPGVADSQARSARSAALETARLEPGPPPQPLPEAPVPEKTETLPARGDDTEMAAHDTEIAAHDEAPLNQPDVWARMRRQFAIARPYSSRVQRQAEWFRHNHGYFDRVAERSRDYLPYIVREAERRGLPLELALLPVIESAFQPFAYSPARASGLWQFIPSTARLYGLRINWWYDGRRDLMASTSAAFDYLEKLHRDFDGDWLLAVAAYNWGEGNLRKALARNRRAGKPLDFWSLKVPTETRTYVPRWLAVCDIVARPEHYGMTLRRVPDEVGFRLVELGHQIDLTLAAELAGISLDRLYRLNAGYRRWATEPQGPHQLLIPALNSEAFARQVASLSPEQRITWGHHEVVAGDTLSGIAERYRTSVDALTHYNKLNDNLIRVGDHLLVSKGPSNFDTRSLSSEVHKGLALTSGDATKAQARRHRVKKGESLWLIARRYGVPVADLVARNRLDPEVWLMPGQVLELRTSSKATLSAASAGRDSGRYVVRNGDNLWLIARRHSVSVGELVAWNGIDPEVWLMPGQVLELRTSSGVSTIASSEPESDRHVVRNGENLWLIARRRAVSVAELRAWNRLDPDDWLMPGQVLEVRNASKTSASASTAFPERGRKRYTVRNGDNLWLIARRHSVSVAELRAWNRLDPDDQLMPGQILELRGDSKHSVSIATRGQEDESYVVRNGDSLWLIARRHSVSAEQLARWNRLSMDEVLRPGQTIMVAPPTGDAGNAATNSL